MNNLPLIPAISLLLICCFPSILSQQPYIRQLTNVCANRDNSTSVLGYTCNGFRRRSCQAYLTFRALPPYDTVSAISDLLAVNSSDLSRLNSVSENAVFEADRTVLVPVTCSCAGDYYQVNASYTVRTGDTFLAIANATYQGLSTCQAISVQNGDIPETRLMPGTQLTVPLRCACPTRNQTDSGVNYLLSYLVTWGQYVSVIGDLFGVDFRIILAANTLSETDTNINPFTTLLVPLQDPPTSIQVTTPQPPPPPSVNPRPSGPPPSDGGSSKTWIYGVVGGVGGVLVVGALVLFVLLSKRKKKSKKVVTSQNFQSVDKSVEKLESNVEDSQDFLDSLASIAQSLKVYPFQEIRTATEDFGPTSWIKGSVYRGTINGDFAAIKKMNGDVSKEIILLNKINHFNLIRLSGVSFNEGNWYLVYEYAANGSLNDWINHNNKKSDLNWNTRLQIAVDVAAGLNYLHRYTTPPHIHKDLNSTNVLLDSEFRAKIANFGLARSAEGGQFELTRHIVGTKGYMAPEYLENGIVSPKIDVYAFGVLLLEILTGKEVSELYEVMDMQLREVISEDGHQNVGKLMDPMLQGKYPMDVAVQLFRMISNCLNKNPSDRPNMDDIFQSLSRISTSGEWSVSISENQSSPR